MHGNMETILSGVRTAPPPHPERTQNAPLVSVIMSNFNGSAFLEAAVSSVLGQSHQRLELIVVDDASKDQSLKILQRLAASDHRLILIALDANAGPAKARNAALDAARGEWIAIVDADDLIHPRRIERLLAAAQMAGVDMIADDLVSFGSVTAAGQTLLKNVRAEKPMRITSADLIYSDTVGAGEGSFGYLKPMIRSDVLGRLRYDETLRIGEDFDLYARLLFSGANFLMLTDPTYLYRRHTGSISHRLSVPTVESLINAHDAMAKRERVKRADDTDLTDALAYRRTHLVRALRYQHLVNAIKSRRALKAALQITRHPFLLFDLAASLADRLSRRRSKANHRPLPLARTVVLASPDRMALIDAPLDAILIPVGPESGTSHRSLASRLAKLASQSPLSIVAEGPDGLDSLGYVPGWHTAHLLLDASAARDAIVPPGVTLEVLPDRH